jgi:Sugar phosphate isomerases/epimerases
MERRFNRREFSKAAGLGVSAAWLAGPLAQAAPVRRLKIGHTGITWGYRPENAELAIKEVASLGYDGFESFGNVLEAWEPKGGLGKVLDEAKLPLISAYCTANLTDAATRKSEVDKLVRWGQLIRKCGGTVAVIGPNNVRRPGYDFSAAKANIVTALNDICKALSDIGIVGVLHQHTGTCVEFRDEVYAVMETADTRYVKFGPDIGQLAKGGSDPVKVVKDFLPTIRHLHLKDFNGGPHWTEYCPLGQGKVDVPGILNMLEKAPDLKIAMVELDPSTNPPLTPIETARTSKDYLKKLGYTFRS